MRNMIYQYWKGPLKPGVVASHKLIKKYAETIGAEYRFDHDIEIASKTVDIPIYYEPANPLVDDSFDEYDNVLLIDIDVFPVEGLSENIFEVLDGEDAGICTEPKQPRYREIFNVAGITNENDVKWARLLRDEWGIDYSYDKKSRPMVYNTGVVVISKAGLQKMKKEWPSFQEYVNLMRRHNMPRFYSLFQDYFSAFIHMDGFNFQAMPNSWNSYMHKLGSHPNAIANDTRTEDTKLVHIMFRTADDWPADALWRITNKPMAEWDLPVHAEWPNDPK
jgi:hypothetical protein